MEVKRSWKWGDPSILIFDLDSILHNNSDLSLIAGGEAGIKFYVLAVL